nr:Rieske 2Fe-2S domain-containing protein [Ramlibacter albus]
MLLEDVTRGQHGIDRRAFTDPALFDLEMEHIFEGGWIYLAHESQIPRPNDYLTTTMGRQPIILNRDRHGRIGAFLNACAHRGATLCRDRAGRRPVFSCPFHGWSYASSGELLDVRDEKSAGYPAQFDRGAYGLTRVPRVESYRGFIFGSLVDNVPPLEEHLGGAAWFVDLIVDQAPDGIEMVPGRCTYIYHGNWKLQAENGADGYHVATVHANYVAVQQRRKARTTDRIGAITPGGVGARAGGFYAFDNGHVMLWSERASPKDSPNHVLDAQLRERWPGERVDWMLSRSRNLGLYPNLFLIDSMSSHIRQFRPIAVDRTEVTTYCYAPVGEAPSARARRIRQFEDFYNPSGLATPDDLAEFQACQIGFQARGRRWNDLSRGAAHEIPGPDELARTSGIPGVRRSGRQIADEGLFVEQHGAWQQLLLERMRPGSR